jgi:hypothetical protein
MARLWRDFVPGSTTVSPERGGRGNLRKRQTESDFLLLLTGPANPGYALGLVANCWS